MPKISRRWMLAAVALVAVRCVSAFTHSTYAHPDEWYQTLELSRLLMGKACSYFQEIDLHLRNLTWPVILMLPLRMAEWWDPRSLGLRVHLPQLLSAILDLGIAWGWWRMLEALIRRFSLSRRWLWAGMGVLLFPWTTVHDAVRPSIEHISTIAFWVALGCLADGRAVAGGFAAAATGALRYPSGLFSAGLTLGVALRNRRRLARFTLGVVLALVLFGLADWHYYGRPWESLWMYAQYNVLTGTAARVFGHQSAWTYVDYLQGRWFKTLLPFGVLFAVTGVFGLIVGLRERAPWALASAFYLGGHLLIGHKEPRFMEPEEFLWLWGAYEGLARLWVRGLLPEWIAWIQEKRVLYRASAVALAGCLLVNGLFFLRETYGDLGIARETYFGLPGYLAEFPDTCAVVSARQEMTSVLIPGGVAIAEFPSERREPSFPQTKTHEIIWADREPICRAGQSVLVQVNRPHPGWDEHGCEILPSGSLAFLPKSLWNRAIVHVGFVAGPWYRCPTSILNEFAHQRVEHPFVSGLRRIEQLPGFTASTEDLRALLLAREPLPECDALCAYPSLLSWNGKPF